MFVIPTFPVSLFNVPCCLSVLFFVHFSFFCPGQIVRFLISSFSSPPLDAPLLFTLATHLSPSIRPSSGHPAITLHYRHIQHTNFTQNSTWVPSRLGSHWSKHKSPLLPLADTPRGPSIGSQMIIFYNVTYLCWKWLHPMVFWGMRPPFGAGDGCIQWSLLYNWTAPYQSD